MQILYIFNSLQAFENQEIFLMNSRFLASLEIKLPWYFGLEQVGFAHLMMLRVGMDQDP